MSRLIRIFICGYALSFFVQPAFSQGMYYTPFNAAPLNINPAFTGMYEGKLRISCVYQDLWQTRSVPFYSNGLSADMPIVTGRSGSYLASGLQLLREQSKERGLSNFSALLSFAYHKHITKINGDFALGIQAGYAQKSIDLSTVSYSSQFYSPGTSIEYYLGLGNTINYYLLNAGFSFSQSVCEKFNYTIGISGYNLNTTNDVIERQQRSEVGTSIGYSAVFGANWYMSQCVTLQPAILFRKVYSSDFIAGSNIEFTLSKSTNAAFFSHIFTGMYWRQNEALVFCVGTRFKNFRLEIAVNNSYSEYNLRPEVCGLQFQLQYITRYRKAVTRKRFVPCNRF
jgi:type IX secretion system PorP/SprF family membrane protein